MPLIANWDAARRVFIGTSSAILEARKHRQGNQWNSYFYTVGLEIHRFVNLLRGYGFCFLK